MSVVQRIRDVYETSKLGSDLEVDEWPFMGSPIPVLLVISAYASFVLYFGPRFMKDRKPFKIEKYIIAYNAFQVFYSAYLVTLSTESQYFYSYFFGFGCTSISKADDDFFDNRLKRGMWMYTIAKVIDLLDTCFFVLRKKSSNISFLHVYHHIGTLLISWILLKYFLGQECLVVGLLNSFVHVVMYFYYLCAALANYYPVINKFLWWKKYLTWLQLAQFTYIFIHMGLALMFSCRWNLNVIYATALNSVFHFYLFMNFYQKAYKKQADARSSNNNNNAKAKKSE